ncbi:MAG TPA: PilN domain-containing protein [Thermoanaerobaculia bacterium]|nr:PilN domain-containing protein [Thermoanaerobaculia bacterium]
MIKINLVGEGRKPVIARREKKQMKLPAFSGEDAALYALILGFAVGAIVFGVWFFMLRGTINENQDRIRVAQSRVDELQEIIRKVEEFEREQAELEQKIAVITELKNNQRGPVDLMDKVSQALPDRLWIDRMESRGDRISIRGRAQNSNAISDFIQNLSEVRGFNEPFLRDMPLGGGGVYSYTIDFQQVAVPDEPEDAESAAAGAASSPAGVN